MGRFESTAAFYDAARPPYGGAFFAEVARRLPLCRRDRLLDLGTGPGLLALGFAPFVGAVVGLDPEPEMIEAARQAAARPEWRGRDGPLAFLQGRAEALPFGSDAFDVVTIGRALHWMETGPTRTALDRVVAPLGAVLVCRAATCEDGSNPWFAAYSAARQPWRERDPAHGRNRDLAAFFAGSRFCWRDTIRVAFTQDVSVERLSDRVLSMSASSAARLGDRVGAMRAAVGAALAPFAADGLLRERVEACADVFRAA